MNLFKKAIDRWDFAKATCVDKPADMSVYCYGLEFICLNCAKKYSKILIKCPKQLRETIICGWCDSEQVCVPVHYAGWPNIRNPETKSASFNAGGFTIE